MTHELGHGFEEAAAGAAGQGVDPQIVQEYGEAVGWHDGRLYDIGAPDVEHALERHEAPPAAFEITAQNWQRGWREQPISAYQVGHGPFEDLPAAIMAYSRSPQLLHDRSPHRFAFVENRRQLLQHAHALRPPDAAAAAGTR